MLKDLDITRTAAVVPLPPDSWGKTVQVLTLSPGVIWFVTEMGSGLGVSPDMAAKHLSKAARLMGDRLNGWLWYEGVYQWMIPFYEKPSWYKLQRQKTVSSKVIPVEKMEAVLKRIFPRYFKEIAA